MYNINAKIGVLEISRQLQKKLWRKSKGDERDCERKLLATDLHWQEKVYVKYKYTSTSIHEQKLKVEEKLVAGTA